MKLKMTVKILMMIGLFILTGQAPIMASEHQVTFQVPVSIRDLSDADSRHIGVNCRIGTKLLGDKSQTGLQLSHGSFNGTVRIIVKSHLIPFKVGTPYTCNLTSSRHGLVWLSARAKKGSHPVVIIAGKL